MATMGRMTGEAVPFGAVVGGGDCLATLPDGRTLDISPVIDANGNHAGYFLALWSKEEPGDTGDLLKDAFVSHETMRELSEFVALARNSTDATAWPCIEEGICLRMDIPHIPLSQSVFEAARDGH